MSERRAFVVASGADPEPLRDAVQPIDVICADGGVMAARSAGLPIAMVVGDLDSAPQDVLDEVAGQGAEVRRHPRDKDESDLELALGAAVARGATEIGVHLGVGGRLDHQLANLVVLASPRWSVARVWARIGADRVWVVRAHCDLPLEVGAPVALHAIGGPATEVVTEGLSFELAGETLDPFVARGISNRVGAAQPSISVGSGVLLVVSSGQGAQAT